SLSLGGAARKPELTLWGWLKKRRMKDAGKSPQPMETASPRQHDGNGGAITKDFSYAGQMADAASTQQGRLESIPSKPGASVSPNE
ncbi:MAG TPA: hypothetical protein VIM99_18540, partial [Blastocatellia bacterium]